MYNFIVIKKINKSDTYCHNLDADANDDQMANANN
jgi:hypothetical protein